MAPALAEGNTVVVKPSEVAPLSTQFAARLAAEAGLPPGVLNVTQSPARSVDTMTREDLLARLRETGLVHGETVRMKTFGGGVSSDVWRVQEGNRTFVVKRSVPKLRVAADWFADPARLIYEFRYLKVAGDLVPGCVPKLLTPDFPGDFIAMEYLDGFRNWKEDLLSGRLEEDVAARAGETLGRLHASTRARDDIRTQFDSLRFFCQLRLDAYLRTTASKHPGIAPFIEAEANRLADCSECLVHGDFSPKNILVTENRLVALDCETAWFGDPAFDLAFVLNHLHLKALYHAPKDPGLGGAITSARTAYFAHCGLEPNDAYALDFRTARLLLMLLLARADGKSPVEYLNDPQRATIRSFVLPRLPSWDGPLDSLTEQWFDHIFLSP